MGEGGLRLRRLCAATATTGPASAHPPGGVRVPPHLLVSWRRGRQGIATPVKPAARAGTVSVACPRSAWAAGVPSWGRRRWGWLGGAKGCRRRRRWLPIGGSLGGRGPLGAAEGKRRKVPLDTKVPRARVEARGAGGEAGVGEDAGAAGSLETRRLRAGGLLGGGGALAWGTGRHKAPGGQPLWLAGHTPECRSNRRRRDCGKPREPGRWCGGGGGGFHRCLGCSGFSQCFSVSQLGGPGLSSLTSPPHCHIAFPCGFFPTRSLPYFSPTPSGVSSVLPSARGTFANDRMPDSF